MEEQFHDWADRLATRLGSAADTNAGKDTSNARGKKARRRVPPSVVSPAGDATTAAAAAAVEYDTDAEEGSDDDAMDDDGGLSAGSEDDMDMEDIGAGGGAKEEKREMVTPQLRAALTKQGYKILGSHSGVKLCRWTKAQLRGRGGCYKHSFYGIESHRCMEATPSLACANKCVFCWRHHTNPVGREWRWQMDDAETLVESAVSEHRGMIKQMKRSPRGHPRAFRRGHGSATLRAVSRGRAHHVPGDR